MFIIYLNKCTLDGEGGYKDRCSNDGHMMVLISDTKKSWTSFM